MDIVAATVKALFWSPPYSRYPFPTADELRNGPAEIEDFVAMCGAERRTALEICNVVDGLKPAFLRAMQHLTTLHSHDTIDPLAVAGGRDAVLNFQQAVPPRGGAPTIPGAVPSDIFPMLTWRRSASVWGGVSEACTAPLLGHSYIASVSAMPLHMFQPCQQCRMKAHGPMRA